MSIATPTKRSALCALDANALTRSPSRPSAAKVDDLIKNAAMTSTPSPKKKKRRAVDKGGAAAEGEVASPALKKLCSATAAKTAGSPAKKAVAAIVKPDPAGQDAEEDSPPASARRSLSPDSSSLFDNSTINTSQLTTITEPDATVPITTTTATAAASAAATTSAGPTASTSDDLSDLPPPRPRRVPPTREECRRRAEILKLRLSLASYKVKTNQTDVPLDKLQVLPVPGMEQLRRDLPSMSAHTVERPTAVQYWYRSLSAVAPPTQVKEEVKKMVGDGEDGECDDVVPAGRHTAAVEGTGAEGLIT